MVAAVVVDVAEAKVALTSLQVREARASQDAILKKDPQWVQRRVAADLTAIPVVEMTAEVPPVTRRHLLSDPGRLPASIP
jgi:hypothetical protein